MKYILPFLLCRAGVPDNVTVYGQVSVTVDQITGLRPFVQYVVMVSGENGVSAQDTDTSGRTVSATITTEEGGEFIDFSTARIERLTTCILSVEIIIVIYNTPIILALDQWCNYTLAYLGKIHAES